MDLMTDLGALALGSRLKRLSDKFMKSASAVYQSHGLRFEPKWFPAFYLLTEKSPLSVTEIAESLQISHPAVIQIVREMEQHGLVVSEKSGKDSRKRLLSISEEGKRQVPALKKLWQTLFELNTQLVQHQRHNVLFAIEELETVLAEKEYLVRFQEYYKIKQQQEVQVIDYQAEHRDDFKRLNVAWIEKYFTIEPHDLEQLEHPEMILEGGGFIFFALYANQIVGTCALVKMDNENSYELVKMAVDEQFQGKQIGKKLGLAAIEKARASEAAQLVLESNTRLVPAIELYKKLGFYKVAMPTDSPYQRANIRMVMDLK